MERALLVSRALHLLCTLCSALHLILSSFKQCFVVAGSGPSSAHVQQCPFDPVLIQCILNFPGAAKLSRSPPTCKSQSPEIRVSPFKITGQVFISEVCFPALERKVLCQQVSVLLPLQGCLAAPNLKLRTLQSWSTP